MSHIKIKVPKTMSVRTLLEKTYGKCLATHDFLATFASNNPGLSPLFKRLSWQTMVPAGTIVTIPSGHRQTASIMPEDYLTCVIPEEDIDRSFGEGAMDLLKSLPGILNNAIATSFMNPETINDVKAISKEFRAFLKRLAQISARVTIRVIASQTVLVITTKQGVVVQQLVQVYIITSRPSSFAAVSLAIKDIGSVPKAHLIPNAVASAPKAIAWGILISSAFITHDVFLDESKKNPNKWAAWAGMMTVAAAQSVISVVIYALVVAVGVKLAAVASVVVPGAFIIGLAVIVSIYAVHKLGNIIEQYNLNHHATQAFIAAADFVAESRFSARNALAYAVRELNDKIDRKVEELGKAIFLFIRHYYGDDICRIFMCR